MLNPNPLVIHLVAFSDERIWNGRSHQKRNMKPNGIISLNSVIVETKEIDTTKMEEPAPVSISLENPEIQEELSQTDADLQTINEELRKMNEELSKKIAAYSSILDSRDPGISIEDAGIRISDGTLLKLEQLYKVFGEFIDFGIWVCGVDGLNLYCSESFLKFSGFTQQQCSGYGWTEVLHPEDKENTVAAWIHTITTGSNLDIEHRFRGKDGTWHYVLTKGVPVRNENGEILYWIGINLNIDKQKISELALIESQRREEQHVRELKELNATKDKLFSIIAHDLINPFNSILGFSDLLQKNLEKYDNAKIEHFLNIINSTSRNAYNLLENLLNWSRAQTGNLAFNPGTYNLTEIIQANIQFIENLALKKNIRINFNASSEYLVEIDKNMIDTVLRNLLTNAVKFSYPEGSITIQIEPAELFCKITVKDEGIGIEEENIGRLFQPNNRFISAGTVKEKGSGLGLIICKEFIEIHKGRIWVRSESGKGSEFSFTLPWADSSI